MPVTDFNNVFSGQNNTNNNPADVEAYLRKLSEQLERLIKMTANQSQSAAYDQDTSTRYRNMYSELYTNGGSRKRGTMFHRSSRSVNGFSDAVEEGLLNALLGSDYKRRMGRAVADFADTFGLDLANIREQLGRELGKQVGQAFRNSGLGRSVFSGAERAADQMFNRAAERFQRGVGQYDARHGTSFSSAAAEWIHRTRTNQNRVPSQQEARSFFGGGGGRGPGGGGTSFGSNYAGPRYTAKTIYVTADVVNCSSANFGSSSGPSVDDISNALQMITDTNSETSLVSVADSASAGLGEMMTAADGAGAAVSGLMDAAMAFAPEILIAVAAVSLISAALKFSLGPAIEGTKKMLDALGKSGTRNIDSRRKQVELEKKRIEDDLSSIVRKPFEILEAAANNLYEAWDNNLRKINATQGYNKEDLQSLMAAFAQRLRDEGLSDVISTSDILTSLSTVLDSGLSGQAAEEFAYLAAKLNAAVPSQDFFGYASTYASIAANAVKSGMSQSKALEYANDQMYAFADSILYASRNLAGGFTTGLKNAQSLFEQSVQIAQASRTSNISQIGGVMTAVSAVVGAIAPDLASAMTDMIYKAATGGNASELVAFRSLANINASNTEFLRQLANDPQKVFAELFKNLANMQHMADGAWMEVAEGLSDVFGVSMDAFARVDFAYLARVISEMNSSGSALLENMDLLISGQTTTNEDQLKIAQINKYMIEEGLSYVLDNDAARAIQQHMWEEQIAQELMEAEYGVNLHGAALDFLQGLKDTATRIMNFLNPIGFLVGAIGNIISSSDEYDAQEADVRQLLELGKVGQGNATSLYQLVTRGESLNVTDALVNLLGGTSAYRQSRIGRQLDSDIFGRLYAWDAAGGAMSDEETLSAIQDMKVLEMQREAERQRLYALGKSYFEVEQAIAEMTLDSGTSSHRVSSKYRWGMISKAQAAKSNPVAKLAAIITGTDVQTARSEANTKLIADKLGKLLDEDYIRGFASDSGKTYEDWVATASSFGISDIGSALQAVGKTEEDLKSIFSDFRTEAGSTEKRRREAKEEELWDATFAHQPNVESLIGTSNELVTGTNELLTSTNELLTATNMTLSLILKKESDFYQDWVNYFVQHTAYDKAYDYDKVRQIQANERDQSDSAIYALAEALSKNTVDLRDPAVQTNALLSQILLVVNAMLQQNNQSGATTLLGTLAGLALGGEKPTI